MDNKLEIFKNDEFGDVRTIVINEEPWFVGKDVAAALGYGKGKSLNNAVASHVDNEDKGVTEMMTPDGKQNLIIINESGLYFLILSSKLPNAKKFKNWVTSEVLPTIRKHGAYMTGQTLEKALTSPDFLIKLATQLKSEQEARKLAEQRAVLAEEKIEEQKPKVEFHDSVSISENSVSFGDFAASFQNNHKSFGRNKMMDWCRNRGFYVQVLM